MCAAQMSAFRAPLALGKRRFRSCAIASCNCLRFSISGFWLLVVEEVSAFELLVVVVIDFPVDVFLDLLARRVRAVLGKFG